MNTTKEHIFGFPTSILNLDAVAYSDIFAINKDHEYLPHISTLIPCWDDHVQLNAHKEIATREAFEACQDKVHFATYFVITRYDATTGELGFFTYQRTKKVGEQQLAGNHSIGVGGHTTLDPEVDQDASVFDVLERTIYKELTEELRFFNSQSTDLFTNGEERELAHYIQTAAKPLAIIHDRTNAVGKRHLGLLGQLHLIGDMDVAIRESELTQVGFLTLDQLSEYVHAGTIENWSVIAMNTIAQQMPASLVTA